MYCKKCKTKKATELYYNAIMETTFRVSVDEKGNEDIDDGGYTILDEFLDNMLVEKKRKLIGCDKCIEDKFTY